MIETDMTRRGLIGSALGLAAALPAAALGARPGRGLAEKRLVFRNVHNGEKVDARWLTPRGLDRQGLAEIDHGLRDWRTGQVARMDPRLVDLLTTLRDRLGVSSRRGFDIISGYRSPATNAGLRIAGGAHTGVATKSQHMLGKATDLALPGIPLDRVRLAALSLRRGGVGFYPQDGFVHVDTGGVRHW